MVVNDRTFHHLYLPFARESDVPERTNDTHQNKNRLKQSTVSVSHFKRLVSAQLNLALSPAHPLTHNTTNDIWVFMSNDMVCPDAYIGGYRAAATFLTRELNGSMLDSVSHRRGTDRTAGLAFTLDYYGSSFAAELAARHVSQAYPGFRLLKMRPSVYPAVCLLTHQDDGRHFMYPSNRHGDDGQTRVYYLLKARLLLHLILGQILP